MRLELIDRMNKLSLIWAKLPRIRRN